MTLIAEILKVYQGTLKYIRLWLSSVSKNSVTQTLLARNKDLVNILKPLVLNVATVTKALCF